MKPTAREAIADLSGTKCAACDGVKAPAKSFCYRCFMRLPGTLRKALYQKIGGVYEQAFADACAHLWQGIDRSAVKGAEPEAATWAQLLR